MPDNHTTPDVYRHNSVTTMCDDICTILTRNGATITEHEEYPRQDHRTLTLHGTYRNRGIFLNVQFDNIRGAFDGTAAIDTDATYLDEFADLQHEECGYPLEGFCEICIDDYGICRPEHIVSTVINHFNLNS